MSFNCKLLLGSAHQQLAFVEDASVQTVITSPPYYGLRDYGVEPSTWADGWVGALGLEPTPEMYVDHLVEVFSHVHRTLHADGTLWLNLGDSYARRGGTGVGKTAKVRHTQKGIQGQSCQIPDGYKEKDLLGIPWMVAFALRAAGWYLRQDIIWHKQNPMPAPVTDRCVSAHEYLFLLSKSSSYVFDHVAIQEPTTGRASGNKGSKANKQPDGRAGFDVSFKWDGTKETRNKRSVWSLAFEPKSGDFKHFATFPKKLVEPCVLAGSQEGDVVLDPFSGLGTTGMVALSRGRRYLGVEMNQQYLEMSATLLREAFTTYNAEKAA